MKKNILFLLFTLLCLFHTIYAQIKMPSTFKTIAKNDLVGKWVLLEMVTEINKNTSQDDLSGAEIIKEISQKLSNKLTFELKEDGTGILATPDNDGKLTEKTITWHYDAPHQNIIIKDPEAEEEKQPIKLEQNGKRLWVTSQHIGTNLTVYSVLDKK
jgi:hypothetical protein